MSGYDLATIVQAAMRERENARLAQGSFIHRLIEEALLSFNSLQNSPAPPSDLQGGALDAELFVDSASPAGLPTVHAGNLAALEDEAAGSAPPQRRRVAIGIVVLLVLAAALLAWFAGR